MPPPLLPLPLGPRGPIGLILIGPGEERRRAAREPSMVLRGGARNRFLKPVRARFAGRVRRTDGGRRLCFRTRRSRAILLPAPSGKCKFSSLALTFFHFISANTIQPELNISEQAARRSVRFDCQSNAFPGNDSDQAA